MVQDTVRLSSKSRSDTIPDWIQEWITYYNDLENQSSGQVKTVFSQNAQEVEETLESIDRRKFSTTEPNITLARVSRNKGSFWLIMEQDRGWLFPKIESLGQWSVIRTLFKIHGQGNVHTSLQLDKPAILTSDDQRIWTLMAFGEMTSPITTSTEFTTIHQKSEAVVTVSETQNSPDTEVEILKRQIQGQREIIEQLYTHVKTLNDRIEFLEKKISH